MFKDQLDQLDQFTILSKKEWSTAMSTISLRVACASALGSFLSLHLNFSCLSPLFIFFLFGKLGGGGGGGNKINVWFREHFHKHIQQAKYIFRRTSSC